MFDNSRAIFILVAVVTVFWMFLSRKSSIGGRLELSTSKKQRMNKKQQLQKRPRTQTRAGWFARSLGYGSRVDDTLPQQSQDSDSSEAVSGGFLNGGAPQESDSLFERDKKRDLARPLMERLDNSLFEKDKEDDLTRPFNYGNDVRNTTNLFELDKKDDLTREW